ncbi:MAG: FCD domain-containing protein [Proteobacteria bacterium]|nr:FCD domain-containing protein [Pseudomonadota bacterium]
MSNDAAPARTMAAALASSIRTDIIKGALAPGAKLPIKELCDRYSAGAIPMREALSRLATGGFVVAEDMRGFRVAEVSADELADITEARIHVECEALRRAIEHGGLDWEERLAGAHHRLSRLPMLAEGRVAVSEDWDRAHAAFHSALIGGCGSKWLVTLAELLRDQTARYRHLSVANERRTPRGKRAAAARDVPAEHQQIVDAALARDANRACALLAEHFRTTTQLVLGQTA